MALCDGSGPVRVDQERAAERSGSSGGEWCSHFLSVRCGLRLTPPTPQIGAGVSLPGVLAAACGACVTLTDMPACLESCRRSCRANGLPQVAVVGLTWGEVSPELVALQVDVILGSDVFYDPPGESSKATPYAGGNGIDHTSEGSGSRTGPTRCFPVSRGRT